MKTLILVRHGKSSWDDPSLGDRDRPLNDRGRRNASKMGKRLAKLGARPQAIVSSPASRAIATARLMARELDFGLGKIRVDEGLYLAEAGELLRIVRKLDREWKRVMLVGHNPGLLDLAHGLAAGIDRMPTCAVAVLAFRTKSWAEVGAVAPVEVDFHAPRKA